MLRRLSADSFVAWCKSMIGQPYWYGTTVAKCTDDLLKRKTAQYPEHYTTGRMARYKADISAGKTCADCIGASKGYAWTNGGTDKMVYQSNGCPDKSANGMFDWAKSQGMPWGMIDTLPELPGVAVRFDGHVGYYIGGGYVIEWRGFAYGCVRTRLTDRPWKHWYRLPWLDYAANVVDDGCPYAAPTVNIRRGAKGQGVFWIQWQLVRHGYSVGPCGIDGDFGGATDGAVRRFQSDHGLEIDGIVGPMTRAELNK